MSRCPRYISPDWLPGQQRLGPACTLIVFRLYEWLPAWHESNLYADMQPRCFSSVYLHAWRCETGAYLLAQAGAIRAGAKPATNQPDTDFKGMLLKRSTRRGRKLSMQLDGEEK
jgi:hypothetical protein